jgi:anti-sigma B factor antagonist
MADPRNPVVMIGGVPVVEAPQEIDVANAKPFREILVQAACREHAPVVVNMTGTRFCDSSGVKALLSAQKHAVADGGELLLVIPPGAPLLRIFALTGIDRLIPHLADLNEALEAAHAVIPQPLEHPATPSTDAGVPEA